MTGSINIHRHDTVDPNTNPTGESLLSRTVVPYKIWTPDQKMLVLGNSQSPETEFHFDAVHKSGIPVYKRTGGGGAVLLSPGCLCLGLRFQKKKELSIQNYFSMGSTPVQLAVEKVLGIQLESRGISDLVIGNRKVAGCSLYMPRNFVLYLVSILIDPDYEEIEKLLCHPSKEPDYRMKRSHRSFIVGLRNVMETLPETKLLMETIEEEILARRDELDWELC